MARYRKKPVVIEAVQYDGANHEEVIAFVGDGPFFGKGAMLDRAGNVIIATLGGSMRTTPRDYVIRGVQGEHYPCKPDIFQATYELVVGGDCDVP